MTKLLFPCLGTLHLKMPGIISFGEKINLPAIGDCSLRDIPAQFDSIIIDEISFFFCRY